MLVSGSVGVSNTLGVPASGFRGSGFGVRSLSRASLIPSA